MTPESDYLVPMTTNQIPLASARLIQFIELIGEFVTSPYRTVTLANSCADLTNEIVREAVDDALDQAESPFRRIMDEQEVVIGNLRDEVAGLRAQIANQPLRSGLTLAEETKKGIEFGRWDPATLWWLRESKKINAIKRVRSQCNIGLKAAKEAVESSTVQDAVHAYTFCCIECDGFNSWEGPAT